VLPKEIGIISPYRRQVQKLRDLMNRKFQNRFKNWQDITVGSTEEFQGQVSIL
jgi:superfamily I DNA and/or RNA helicase